MNVDNITNINNIVINGQIKHISIKSCFFFILLTVKLFLIFPKHNRYGFISRVFCFEFIYFFCIIKKTVASIIMQTETEFFSSSCKINRIFSCHYDGII